MQNIKRKSSNISAEFYGNWRQKRILRRHRRNCKKEALVVCESCSSVYRCPNFSEWPHARPWMLLLALCGRLTKANFQQTRNINKQIKKTREGEIFWDCCARMLGAHVGWSSHGTKCCTGVIARRTALVASSIYQWESDKRGSLWRVTLLIIIQFPIWNGQRWPNFW